MFCHKCGTSIKEGAAFCPSCGQKIQRMDNTVLVADVLNFTSASEEMSSHDLTEAIGHLVEPIANISTLAEKGNELYRTIDSLEKADENDTFIKRKFLAVVASIPTGLPVALVVFGIILGFLIPPIGHLFWASEDFCAISVIAMMVVSFFVYSAFFDRQATKRKETIKEKKQEAEENLIQLNHLCEQIDKNEIALIPPDYRYGHAVEFIYKALLNQRAMNMQQAVNLYEDHMHKERLEKMQAAQVEYLNQMKQEMDGIRTTSAIGAAASTANLFLNLFP